MLIKMIMNKLYLECNMRRFVLLTVIVFYISLLHMNTAYSNYTKALKAFEDKDWVECIKICDGLSEDEDKCDNLLGIISIENLQYICLGSFAIGLIIYLVRKFI